MLPYSVSWRWLLTSSSNLYLGPWSSLFPSHIPTKILCAFLISHLLCLILLEFIKSGRDNIWWVVHIVNSYVKTNDLWFYLDQHYVRYRVQCKISYVVCKDDVQSKHAAYWVFMNVKQRMCRQKTKTLFLYKINNETPPYSTSSNCLLFSLT